MKKIFVGFASIALFAMLVVACANAVGGSGQKSEDKGSKNGGNYFTIDGYLITAYDSTKIPADGHIVIPEGVTEIDARRVQFGKEVKSITIPSTLASCGAFRDLPELESVTFAEGVTSIPADIFYGC